MADIQFTLNESDVVKWNWMIKELQRIGSKVDGIKGKGITNSYRNLSIDSTVDSKETIKNPKDWFWARITGQMQNGSNNWIFTYQEIRRTIDSFEDMVDGRVGTFTDNFAINTQMDSLDNDEITLGTCYVQIWISSDKDGTNRFTFDKSMSINRVRYDDQITYGTLQASRKDNGGNGSNWIDLITFGGCPS